MALNTKAAFLIVMVLVLLTFNADKALAEKDPSCQTNLSVYNVGDTITFIVTVPDTGNYYLLIYLPDGSTTQLNLGTLNAGTYSFPAGQAGQPPGQRTILLFGAIPPGSSFQQLASCGYGVQGPPKLQVFISASPTTGNAPLTVSFSSQVSGGNPPYPSYAWTFGDGGTDNSPGKTTHVYSQQGQFQAYLRVTDASGNSAPSNSLNIQVGPPQPQNVKLTLTSYPADSPFSGSVSCYSNPLCEYPAASTATVTINPNPTYTYELLALIFDGKAFVPDSSSAPVSCINLGAVGGQLQCQITMDRDHSLTVFYHDLTAASTGLIGLSGNLLDPSNEKTMESSVVHQVISDATSGATSTSLNRPEVGTDEISALTDIATELSQASGGGAPGLPVGDTITFIANLKEITDMIHNCPGGKCPTEKLKEQYLSRLKEIIVESLVDFGPALVCGAVLSVPGAIACSAASYVFSKWLNEYQLSSTYCAGAKPCTPKIALENRLENFWSRASCDIQVWFFSSSGKCAQANSPVLLLVVDSSGRRTGAGLSGSTIMTYNEIPSSYYNGPDAHPQVIFLENSQDNYNLVVTASDSGQYTLRTVQGAGGNVVTFASTTGDLKKGQTAAYRFDLSGGPSAGPIWWMYYNQSIWRYLAVSVVGIILTAIIVAVAIRRKRYERLSLGQQPVEPGERWAQESLKICPNCGQQLDAEDYCGNCGQRLRQS